jgi:hypothetical protein
MRITRIITALIAIVVLSGCNDDDNNCDDNVSGCSSSDYYSCPGADYCYGTKSACSSSGECDK